MIDTFEIRLIPYDLIRQAPESRLNKCNRQRFAGPRDLILGMQPGDRRRFHPRIGIKPLERCQSVSQKSPAKHGAFLHCNSRQRRQLLLRAGDPKLIYLDFVFKCVLIMSALESATLRYWQTGSDSGTQSHGPQEGSRVAEEGESTNVWSLSSILYGGRLFHFEIPGERWR